MDQLCLFSFYHKQVLSVVLRLFLILSVFISLLILSVFISPFNARLSLLDLIVQKMKFTSVLFGSAVLGLVAASPRGSAERLEWKKKLAQIKERALLPPDSPEDSFEMIGDLVSPGPTTPVGQLVSDILLGVAEPQTSETYPLLGLLLPFKGTTACAKDSCCIWKYIADEMAQKFRAPGGKCNRFARFAVRGGFHDAGPWEKGLDFGGADGSLVLAGEITRPENAGLEEMIPVYQQWYASRFSIESLP
jgi:hypothetical protein